MEKLRNAHKILIEKCDGKRLCGDLDIYRRII
jgi:hypothetical protein